jgi:hypothetical protein
MLAYSIDADHVRIYYDDNSAMQGYLCDLMRSVESEKY